MKTYVYDGTEVKKTGREAVRTVSMPNSKTRNLTVIEVTPVVDFDWKKWVRAEELYEIIAPDASIITGDMQ